MAVYTPVSAEALDAFLVDYDLEDVRSLKGIAEGIENTNYLLETARGRFILTLYEKRVKAADLPYFMALLHHLSLKGVPVATPRARRDGTTISTLCGKPAAILTFLDGVSVTRPSLAQAHEAGRALAAMHQAAADFPLRRANDLWLPGLARLAAGTAARASEVAPGLGHLIADELEAQAAHDRRGLAAGPIHADLFPDNVLFLGDRLTGLIDFYFAGDGLFAYDLAIMLNAWAFHDGALDPVIAGAIIGGYERTRALTAAERAAMPMLARMAALRFLLTRLHDWLHPAPDALVRPKNPRDYMAILAWHRSTPPPAAYGLA